MRNTAVKALPTVSPLRPHRLTLSATSSTLFIRAAAATSGSPARSSLSMSSATASKSHTTSFPVAEHFEWIRPTVRTVLPYRTRATGGAVSSGAFCSVCNGDCEESEYLYQCDDCHISVHPSCYYHLPPTLQYNIFICLACQCKRIRLDGRYRYDNDAVPIKGQDALRSQQLIAAPLSCALCGVESERVLLKPTNENTWACLICAVWLEELWLNDNGIIQISDLHPDRALTRCLLCHRSGACIQCSHRSCYVAFHPSCARIAGYRMELHVIQDRDTAEQILNVEEFTDAYASPVWCPKHCASKWKEVEYLNRAKKWKNAGDDAGAAKKNKRKSKTSDRRRLVSITKRKRESDDDDDDRPQEESVKKARVSSVKAKSSKKSTPAKKASRRVASDADNEQSASSDEELSPDVTLTTNQMKTKKSASLAPSRAAARSQTITMSAMKAAIVADAKSSIKPVKTSSKPKKTSASTDTADDENEPLSPAIAVAPQLTLPRSRVVPQSKTSLLNIKPKLFDSKTKQQSSTDVDAYLHDIL